MKLLRVAFENLNSIERAELDFTAEPLRDAGLFAIVGPTGAGKSTILDAITLALYGRVARYNASEGEEAKTQRQMPWEVMSYSARECRASVNLQPSEGEPLRAEWTLRLKRGRERASAADDLVEGHTLCSLETGIALTEKLTPTRREIAAKVGLSFERFLRSVLLAQGQFDAFLRAGAEERSALLEQLTDTAVYTALSRRLHEHWREMGDEQREQQAALDALVPLTEEERGDLVRVRTEHSTQIETLAERRRGLSSLLEMGERLGAQNEELEVIRQSLNRIESEREGAEVGATTARTEHAEAVHLLNERLPEIAQARALDEKIGAVRSRERTLDEGYASRRNDHERERADAERARVDLERLRSEIAEQEVWCANHASNQLLAQDLLPLSTLLRALDFDSLTTEGDEVAEGCDQSLDLLITQQSELRGEAERLRALLLDAERYVANRTLLAEREGEAERMGKELEEWDRNRVEAERLLDLQKEICSLLERAVEHEAQLRVVAELRVGLTEGDPCPVCGALHHPSAAEQIDGASVSQMERERALSLLDHRREQVQQIEVERAGRAAALTAIHQSLHRERDALTEQEHALQSALNAPIDLAVLRTRHDVARERAVVASRALRARTRNMLGVYGLNLPSTPEEGSRFVAELSERSRWYGERTADLEQKRARLEGAAAVVERSVAAARLSAERCGEIEAQLESVRAERAELERGRAELLNGEDVGSVEQRTREAVERSTERVRGVEEQLRLLAVQRTDVEEGREKVTREREKLAATLTEHERMLFEPYASIPDAAEIEREIADLVSRHDELQRSVGAIDQRMDDDRERQRRRVEASEALEQRGREIARWRRLNELIGSHDGRKFRAVAQSLTLRLLVQYASTYLFRFSRKQYRLHTPSTGTGGMELSVIDRWNADALRPVSGLSGGERFMVSLALALALSNLAADRVRINALFIDEGFGSLDSDSLSEVLAVLENLQQQSGRTVGVISHVEALKDRIGVRVSVERQPNGRSRVRVEGGRQERGRRSEE